MFKLLTDKERRKIAHEYVMHRTIIMLLGLALVSLSGVIGLLPSYVLSNARQNEALERTKIMNNVEYGEDESELQSWLLRINKKLKVLSPKLDVDRPSDFIERVLAQRVKGVRLTDFSWTKTGDKTTLSVSGMALDRQTLITFENRLNASGHFSEVTLPISSLAKDKDIDFQISFLPI